MALAGPALAQDPDTTIVVVAPRIVFGVEPERTLSEDDISAYGLSSMGEVLEELALENGDTPDEPVFIVNGQRVASLSDVDDLPAEAIESVDVLPAGSGTRVGASATRRVYNIRLKRRLNTLVVRGAVRGATEGDWLSGRGDATYTLLRGPRRLNLTGRVRHENDLLESDRDVVQPASAGPDAGSFRTLRPEIRQYEFGLRAADRLAPWLRGSVSSRYTDMRSDALLGSFDPGTGAGRIARQQRVDSSTFNTELSLEADVANWLFNLFGTYRVDDHETRNQRPDAAGLSLAEAITQSTTRNANALLTATGSPFEVPAGNLQLTFGAGVSRDSIEGARSFLGTVTRTSYEQTATSLSADVTVPIASRQRGFLPFLGELTGVAQFGLTDVSGFGTLTNQTYSLVWQPTDRLRLQGAISNGRTPPAVGSLAEPVLETPGVRYFDPLRMETVDVIQISGGTAGLAEQRGIARQLSATYRPSRSVNLQLTGEYRKIDNRNIVTALPQASAAVFEAFPDRFIRDPNGVLVVVDVRPVTFARQSQEQLRLGANLVLPLRGSSAGTSPSELPGDEEDAPAEPRGGSPRLQLNVNYTRMLSSDIVILSGQDPIDLLSPDAVALGGITPPRHQVDFTAGYAERGLGIRLTGQVRSASYLSVASSAAPDVLRFSPLAIFTVRGFIEGSRIFGDAPWARGSRFSLSVANLTNARQKVTDSAGEIPLAYQRAYRDPIGRIVELEFRKVF